MKRILTAAAVLTFLAATPVFALDPPERDESAGTREKYDRTTVIDDVIRMSKAGVDDEAIIKFVRESHDLYVVDADVIIALTDAKVSKAVLTVVMDEAYGRGSRREESRDRGRRTRTVYVRPYAYGPWFSPYYDPFWYGSFGFGYGYRGGFRGGHHGGGHHGGGHHGGGGHRGGRH